MEVRNQKRDSAVSKRIARALQIRDAALRILQAYGEWETLSYGMKRLSVSRAGISISHRSLFQPLPAEDPALLYRAAVLGLDPKLSMPNGGIVTGSGFQPDRCWLRTVFTSPQWLCAIAPSRLPSSGEACAAR